MHSKIIDYDVIEVEGNVKPAVAWCEKTFGPAGARWFIVNKRFHFSEQHDVMLFLLKWVN